MLANPTMKIKMKFTKVFALSLIGVLSLASCSDNDTDYNSVSGVYVSMADAELTYKENKNIVSIPVVVTGAERNGYVTVVANVEEYGSNPAMEDVHYLLTSKTLNIAPEDDTNSFELKLVDDNVVNDPRMFVITLVSAQGAELGTLVRTVVNITDNDNNPYERLAGTWKSGQNAINIEAFEEGETTSDGSLPYGVYYLIHGMAGFGDTAEDEATYGFEGIKATYYFNEATETGNITIAYGQKMPTGMSTSYGTVDQTIFGYLDAEGYIYDDGEVVLEWSDDYSTLTVTKSPISDSAGVPYADFDVFCHVPDGWLFWSEIADVYQFTR